MAGTAIEWTDRTLNPIRARHKVTGRIGWFCMHESPGCINCYSEKISLWRGNGVRFRANHRDIVDIFLGEDVLIRPIRWNGKPRVFHFDMTDVFGDFVPDDWIDKFFTVASLCTNITWQVLTKRSDRMREYFSSRLWDNRSVVVAKVGVIEYRLPLPNVWIGVSVEDKKRLCRLDDLIATPAALRWASFEPLLEDLGDLSGWLQPDKPHLGWGVIGGESGSNARDHNIGHHRNIIRQFKTAGIPIFEKQVGKRAYDGADGATSYHQYLKLKHSKGGDMAEWPEDLRVREFPMSSL